MPGERAYYSVYIDGRYRMFTDPCKVGCRVIRQGAGRRRSTETSVRWTNGGEIQLGRRRKTETSVRWMNGGEVQLGRRRKTETSVRWMNGCEVHLKGEYCVPEINMYWFGGLVVFVLASLSERTGFEPLVTSKAKRLRKLANSATTSGYIISLYGYITLAIRVFQIRP